MGSDCCDFVCNVPALADGALDGCTEVPVPGLVGEAHAYCTGMSSYVWSDGGWSALTCLRGVVDGSLAVITIGSACDVKGVSRSTGLCGSLRSDLLGVCPCIHGFVDGSLAWLPVTALVEWCVDGVTPTLLDYGAAVPDLSLSDDVVALLWSASECASPWCDDCIAERELGDGLSSSCYGDCESVTGACVSVPVDLSVNCHCPCADGSDVDRAEIGVCGECAPLISLLGCHVSAVEGVNL